MITSETKYFPPTGPNVPSLVLNVTKLVGSYMLWIGTADVHPDNAMAAISRGSLCQDWACAMPPNLMVKSSIPSSGTSICRTAVSDIALPMAQRLARRCKKQIFLSVDISPSFVISGQTNQITVEMERRIITVLNEMDSQSKENVLQ